MSSFLKTKVAPFPKKKIVSSEKVTLSEEIEKGTNILNDMKVPEIMIREKDLYTFQGQSTTPTGWFELDHQWLKRKFSPLEHDFYNLKSPPPS